MPVIQLIVLFLVVVFIHSLLPVKNKVISLVISFFLALLFTIQLSSVMLTGEIANYRFYENFNMEDVLSVAGFFGKEGILLALVIALATYFIHYLGQFLREKKTRKVVTYISLLVGIIILSTSGGIVNNAYSTVRLKFAGDASFKEALSALQIDERSYVSNEKVKASKGKNIIVLSLESFEKGYLGDKLKHLTPNLTKLAQQHTLLEMTQSPGGSWTSASIYTVLTGVPAYFSSHGNSIFQSSHENKLTTLPDVLKKAGYDLQYFIGKKEYSGIDDMLQTHGFTVKSEKDFTSKYEVVPWGIQDMDLFKEFKKELLSKKDSNKPFALFLSTIGTHFPNGVPDKRVDSLLPAQKSRLELMASATDYFVGDFINFLKKENLLSNTTFFIYPDHLLMGRKSRVIEDFDERSLFLLTNSGLSESMPGQKKKLIYQIDLPKLILEGAEVEHNARFLADFIPDSNKNAFLRKNAKNLTQLNEAALTTLNLKDGFLVQQAEDETHFVIKNDKGVPVLKEKLPQAGKCHRVFLDESLRPIENKTISLLQREERGPKSNYLDIFKTEDALYAILNSVKNYGLTKKGMAEIVFEKTDLVLFNEVNSSVLAEIVLNSSSWNAKRSSSFVIDGKEERLSRGLTILCFNTQSKSDFKTFDTYGSEADAIDFLSTLKKLDENKIKYVVLAHDSASKALSKFSGKLKEMGFDKLSTLNNRQAYVMHNLTSGKVEKVDDFSLTIQLPYPQNIENKVIYFDKMEKVGFKNNIDRYIAHAGGQIEGVKYTNSREALTKSYAQGFRLFELDISETSDGYFVASHDWNHWKKETNYQGEVPVSLMEFQKHKIRKKYSPMGMKEINKWFLERPEAILITDKIDSPKKFAEKFIDKNRLVMELFSLKAVEEAIQNGVNPLLSEKAISEIKGDVISYLTTNKIEHVALSRKNISSKVDFLRKCRENNIKVYVYHVNFDVGKDEKYVFENEIGQVYGMYADNWLSEFNP